MLSSKNKVFGCDWGGSLTKKEAWDECIAAIQAALGPNFKYYLQGNIMKYLWRFDYKGKPLEDLQKAQWYLNTLMEDVVASDEG